jgi:hypothetical protein
MGTYRKSRLYGNQSSSEYFVLQGLPGYQGQVVIDYEINYSGLVTRRMRRHFEPTANGHHLMHWPLRGDGFKSIAGPRGWYRLQGGVVQFHRPYPEIRVLILLRHRCPRRLHADA